MRFACDSCGAQYMISDDKVGPGGVKVRCKRCGHVVVVRPAAAAAPVVEPAAPEASPAPPPPSEAASQAAESGLDAELGQAFDHAFGGGQAAAPVPETPGEEPEPPPPAPPPETSPPANDVEWYVAIADRQVGPLLAAGVKARWEGGEVGPDTLVWKAGMPDWAPLSGIQDLAHLVAPLPRPAARAPRPVEQSPSAGEPARAPAQDAAREPEPGWKPSAASALAKLASEEMASLAKAEPPPEAAASSLVEKMQLPEGGVDPTGMLPLHLRGVDTTGETLLPRPKGESTEVRQLRKSTNRRLLAAVVAIAAMAGGAVGYVMYAMPPERRTLGSLIAGAPSPTPAPAATPAPTPSANPAPAPNPAAAPAPAGSPPPSATQAPTAGATPPAPAAPVPPPVTATPAPPPSPPPTAAPADEALAKQAKEARASRAARKAKPVQREPERRVATGTPPPAPDKKPAHDPLLDAVPDDDASKELAGTGKKRSVYVPPAPGSQAREVPDRVSDPQLIEGIVGKTAALQTCVEQQKAAGSDARGPLILRWTILPDGSVKDPRSLSEGLAKQPIVPCITGVVKSIRFPKSKLGREVEAFPFRF